MECLITHDTLIEILAIGERGDHDGYSVTEAPLGRAGREQPDP